MNRSAWLARREPARVTPLEAAEQAYAAALVVLREPARCNIFLSPTVTLYATSTTGANVNAGDTFLTVLSSGTSGRFVRSHTTRLTSFTPVLDTG